jgi:AraC-like DNA-binding protein
MAQVQIISPSPALQPFVRAFECIRALPGGTGNKRAVWARPHAAIPIALGPGREAYEYRTGRHLQVPESVVVGTLTRRFADVVLGERQRVFNIIFQPGGLYRLFGVTAGPLADQAVGASDVLGSLVGELAGQLRQADGPRAQAQVAEAFLLPYVAVARAEDAVHRAAARQIAAHGMVPIAALIADSGFGMRQFERRFLEQFGVSPKRFARIVRLDYALQVKSAKPGLSWALVGQMAGYFDQNHLIKDFKSMTGLLPSHHTEHAGGDDNTPLTSWPCGPQVLAGAGTGGAVSPQSVTMPA